MESLSKNERMKRDKKKIKRLTLNKTTITNLNGDEMSTIKGGNEGSNLFTLCLCLTRFCTAHCPE